MTQATLSNPQTGAASLRDTSRSLPIALLRARETVMGPIRLMLADADVTEQQWRVLRVLDEGGTMDPKDIAQRSCLLMPSLTRIMQNLDEKGLISRMPHERDRRKILVKITPAGVDLISRNAPRSNEIFARLEAKLGSQKLEQLLDLLNDLDELDL
ncbi:MAG: homoprotocatechuate degradation operon regulator HpaR [Hyphomicrobiales bacterium]